ncbi:hypothetical protein [Tepidibacillus marianensis]|uniref:hypothetical protein n=1 Tax=Tepidibacillus marianensis TaxID=3131995 RepID=UPI0030D2B58B
MDESVNIRSNATLLLETEEEWIYLIPSEERDQITFTELQQIIHILRDALDQPHTSQGIFRVGIVTVY